MTPADHPTVIIAGDGLSAGISPLGAELQWLRDGAARDLLWDGDPAFWTGRSPILFPVVGEVSGGVIHVDGRSYPMPKHGIARRRLFALVEQAADRVTFRLVADAETRASYPFDFVLDLTYAIEGATLSMIATLTNPGDAPLPASFGFHPALRWPLPYGGARADHMIRFAAPEPAPIRRIDGAGLLNATPRPTPVVGRDLPLDDGLFVDDALIFDALASRALAFGAPGTTGLHVDFPDMPMLGIWTKPGAGFLCVEPWAGIADPAGFSGDFRDKPGVESIAPGHARRFEMRIGTAAKAFDA